MATVVLIGTFDTKGMEYGWLRDRVRELGCEAVLVDAGIGEPQIEADIPAERVAEAAGASLEMLREAHRCQVAATSRRRTAGRCRPDRARGTHV